MALRAATAQPLTPPSLRDPALRGDLDAITGDPLMPPFKRNQRATRVLPMADGQNYLYRREGGAWMELPVPTRITETPAWFIDFAESRTSKQLRPDGTSKSVSRERQREIVAALPESDTSHLSKLVRWLLKRADERSAWPE